MTTTEITGTLENWSIDPLYKDHASGPVYWGYVYGDTKGRFYDGCRIHTSHVLSKKGKLIFTMNSVYRLGKKYEAKDFVGDDDHAKGSI